MQKIKTLRSFFLAGTCFVYDLAQAKTIQTISPWYIGYFAGVNFSGSGVTENPSIEGTMWAIVNYIHNEFYSGDENKVIVVDPIQLRDKFRYSRVTPKRIRIALNYLVQINCCIKVGEEYKFYYENMDNPEVLKQKIKQIDTGIPPLIQQNLNNDHWN